MNVTVRHLYISPGHNFFGHYGQAPGTHATLEVDQVRCRAGRGLEGDRFFDYKPDYSGQITFFDFEVFQRMRTELRVPDVSPGAMRRNVVVEGLDLVALRGAEFSLGDVRFSAAKEAAPCVWMDQAVCSGAEAWLKGRGGLRARILSDGTLSRGPVLYRLHQGQLDLLPGA